MIENNGGTYARFRGGIWVDAAEDNGEWRQVRRVEISETRLLPETSITMPVDLGRLLPAGQYRIRGEMYVDGRRTAPLVREVAFEGHPAVEDLLTDIVLPIEPTVFEYAYQPGATRSGVITIGNPAINPIEVTLSVNLPVGMAGRASATVRDVDISAVDWITVSPQSVRLLPGQSRNVRLLARLPNQEAAQQNYYAEITAEALYLDGQRAGSATGLVEVNRDGSPDAPSLVLSSLTISSTDNPAEYALSLRAINTGDVLLRPDLVYAVVDMSGDVVLSGELTSDIDAPLLPLEARSLGTILGVEQLPVGEFLLIGRAVEVDQELAEFLETAGAIANFDGFKSGR